MTDALKSSMDMSRALFEKLSKHWHGLEEGVYRPGFSPEESEAIQIIIDEAKSMGMNAYQDLAGNTFLIYEGANRNLPVFMSGSHLDAVPNGGRYDGPAGVVAALAAVRAIHDAGQTPDRDMVVAIWRNEESPWFGQFAVGSKLACGDLSAEFLQAAQKNDGRTLKSHMTDVGLNTDALAAALEHGETLLPMDRIAAFVELHIEQGSQLEKAEKPLGIVTGIRGNLRFPKRIRFEGAAGHSGAVPQEERLDAVLAGAAYLQHFKGFCQELKDNGHDIVWSCPIATTGEGASPTTIPAHFEIQPEIRSLSNGILGLGHITLRKLAIETFWETGVKVHINPKDIVLGRAVSIDKNLRDLLSEKAAAANIDAMDIPSGAGHDAAILAQHGVTSGMIFLRHGNDGVSHRPDEIMTLDANDDPFDLQGDFAKAVQVLKDTALNYKDVQEVKPSNGDFAYHLQMRGAKPL